MTSTRNLDNQFPNVGIVSNVLAQYSGFIYSAELITSDPIDLYRLDSYYSPQRSDMLEIMVKFTNIPACSQFFEDTARLHKEEQLRNENPTLQHAYNEYKLLLALYDVGNK